MEKKIHIKDIVIWGMFIGFFINMIIRSIYPTDTDVYYIIAEGRNIRANGIPYTLYNFNFFEIDTVIQNYAWCYLLAFLYDTFGNIGLACLQVIILTLYAIGVNTLLKMKGSKWTLPERALISILILTIGCYINMRPQIITLTILIYQLIILEKIHKTKNFLWGYLIIPLTILHMQIHMSMWIMQIIICLPYICPIRIDLQGKISISIEKYQLKNVVHNILLPILIFLSTLLNPYGIDGSLYIFNGMGEAGKFSISELSKPVYISKFGAYILLLVILTFLFIREFKKHDIYLVLGLALFSMFAIRNIMFVPIAYISLLATISSKARFKNFSIKKLPTGFLAIIMVLMFISIGMDITDGKHFNNSISDNDYFFTGMDDIMAQIPDKNAKIFCQFMDGNYLEFHGYKSFWDARPELGGIKINHKREITEDYLSIVYAKDNMKEILDFYDFEYMIVRKQSLVRLALEKSDSGYELIYITTIKEEDDSLNDIRYLFKKKESLN